MIAGFTPGYAAERGLDITVSLGDSFLRLPVGGQT